MLNNIRNIIFVIAFALSFSVAGYFGIKWIFKKSNTGSIIHLPKTETKDIIVDSLLVVVDSLQVQVDSLHHAENLIQTETVFIPQKVDTALIIRQYYTTYKQTIKHRDKDLDLKLSFDLQQNKVQTPKLAYKILKPVTIIKPITRNTNHLFFGVTLGGSQYELNQFTPEMVFFTGRHGFKLGYNLLDPNRNLQIGYYFKIK